MWNKIKPYIPWNVIEFTFFIIWFNVLNEWLFDGKDASYANMIAGAALFIAIQTRRKLGSL